MSATSDKRSRGVRVLGLSFVILFLLLGITALLLYLSFQGRPSHWESEQARLAEVSDAQREAISESLRNRLMTQWSDPGDKTPVTEADLFGNRRTIEMPYAELNTWIQTEGIELLAEVGIKVPDSAPSAMIDSPGNSLLRISFEVKTKDIDQIIALSFAVTIADDGTLTSTLKQATAGRLPLPVNTAIDIVASQANDGILLDLMQGRPVAPIELPIDKSRAGRLVGLEVQPDALVITRETVRPNKAN
ncbi:MAG: hypothetical protein AB8C95_09630 [Phycisphaeraceae bacterium]